MSRSVSLVSVASSEDSCQATTLTPRITEYDSDLNMEASDSQPAFLQSSLVIQAARSPSVHDKDCNSLPDVPQSNRTLLSGRHESPYLRAILDEDVSSSAEGKAVEHPPNSGLTVITEEELRKTESPEPEESIAAQQCLNSVADPLTEREGSTAGCLPTQLLSRDLPGKNLTPPQSGASQAGAAELKAPPCSDPGVPKDVPCPMESSQAECSSKESDQPFVSAASPASEPSVLTNTKSLQQKEPPPSFGTDNQQQTESGGLQVSDHKDKTVENPDGSEQENSEMCLENLRAEGERSPVPSTSSHIPCSAAGEYSPGFSKTESKCSQEDVTDLHLISLTFRVHFQSNVV